MAGRRQEKAVWTLRETDGAMKYNNEIMLLADLPRPLCPSGKQEGGPWFQLPTVDVQGHLQQHELAVQKLLGLQHLGLRWTSFPSSLAACRDVDEANPQRRLRTLFDGVQKNDSAVS